jgi:hypothetical protein
MLATSNYTKVIVFFISFYTLLIKVRCISFVNFFKNLSALKYIFISVLLSVAIISVFSQLFPESTKDERRLIENKLKKEI